MAGGRTLSSMQAGWRAAGAAAVLAVTAGGAQAAPQILGLSQTHDPVPMHCADGVCYAELSAICLQEKRDVPTRGAEYRPLKGGAVTVVLHLKDGRTLEKPAEELASIMAWRSHAAVRLTIAHKRLARLGAVRVSIKVAAMTTLAPIPIPGDANPLTKAEIDRAKGQQRALAHGLIDRRTPSGVASRLINRMINRLPGGNGADPAFRRKLWQSEIDRQKQVQDPAVKRGLAIARRWARICRGYALRPGQFKSCLETAHDSLMGKTNQKYWKIDGAGG